MRAAPSPSGSRPPSPEGLPGGAVAPAPGVGSSAPSGGRRAPPPHGAPDLGPRPAFEGLRLLADLVPHPAPPDLAPAADDPPLALLPPRAAGLLHLPELF